MFIVFFRVSFLLFRACRVFRLLGFWGQVPLNKAYVYPIGGSFLKTL